MNKYKVSVIIPAYNSAKYISKAIDSVLAQDISKEIIIVNDCSTDNLAEVIAPYVNGEDVICINNEKNIGAAESRNVGVSASNGEYIAFLDADDFWATDKLKKQIELMESTDFVLCCTARKLINEDGTDANRVIPVSTVITYKDLLKHNSINCSSVLIKSDVAKEFPMHHNDCHEDYIMWLEILGKYNTACGINEPLLMYRVSNKGKSGSKFNSAKMTFKVYRRMGFGFFKSVKCFISYTFHGVKKHFFGGRS